MTAADHAVFVRHRLSDESADAVAAIIEPVAHLPGESLLCGGWLHRLLSRHASDGCDVDVVVPPETSLDELMADSERPDGSARSSVYLRRGERVYDVFAADDPAARIAGFDFDALHAFVRFDEPEWLYATDAAIAAIRAGTATAVQPVLQRRVGKLRARGVTVTVEDTLDDGATWDERIHRRVVGASYDDGPCAPGCCGCGL